MYLKGTIGLQFEISGLNFEKCYCVCASSLCSTQCINIGKYWVFLP